MDRSFVRCWARAGDGVGLKAETRTWVVVTHGDRGSDGGVQGPWELQEGPLAQPRAGRVVGDSGLCVCVWLPGAASAAGQCGGPLGSAVAPAGGSAAP